VTGPPKEEIYTDEHGRIKVHFHWDRNSGYSEKSSCWVRVSQAAAGSQWCCVSIPRVGEEVMIAYESGLPDRPIVIGRLYNGQHPAPYPLPANKTRSPHRQKHRLLHNFPKMIKAARSQKLPKRNRKNMMPLH
jgi:type VI secretion system secreted protein VgrG